MATIKDVARMAGVSPATVSRVLNGNCQVTAQTENKVRKAAAMLCYVPNFSARNLRKNENMTVAIFAPNFTRPFYSHILVGISDAAQALGYSVFICNAAEAETEALKSMLDNSIRTQRADGMIILSNVYNATWVETLSKEIPIVQCCDYVQDLPLPHIAIDNYRAAYEAVEYLLNLGHRRIALLSAANRHISTKLRYEGYCDALRSAGLSPRPELHVEAAPDYSYNSGYVLANKLFGLQERPSAVFCIADMLAASVITAANDRGLRVPGDVSVVGFDDVDCTTMFHPHVTAITQPCYEMGKQSMHALHAYKTSFPQAPALPFVAHTLTIRESAAPYRLV